MLAMLLMLVAPVISRWQQANVPVDDPVLCHSETYADAENTHAHHSSHNTSSDDVSHNDHHDDHGIACDYCVLVARLLPLLVLAWLLPALLPHAVPNAWRVTPVPQAAYWPAPNPRGPPFYS